MTESDNGKALNCFCPLYAALEYLSSANNAGGIEKLSKLFKGDAISAGALMILKLFSRFMH